MIYVRTEPRSEPIRLAEARKWLGMTDDNDTDQDSEIWAVLRAMRRYAEKFTGRCFVDRDLELNLDCWPGNCIELPVAPIVAVEYIKYLDIAGVLQTLYDVTVSPQVGEDQIQIDLKSQPARIQPAWGKYWPPLRAYDFNSVQIGFTAGYGTGGSPEDLTPIPDELRLWLRIRLATVYENREAIVVDQARLLEIPRSHNDALLDPLMLGRRIG